MTLIDEVEMKCSVCGKSSNQPILLSSNQMGYQDLDTRPSEMYRHTMETWAMKCPHCGYVATSLDDDLIINADYLKSDQYRTCDNMEFKSELAEMFYRQYLIENEKFEEINAFFALMHCTWACDDAKDRQNSKLTRQKAINLANKIIKARTEDVTDLIVMKADLLRRIGEFDRLIMEYKNLKLKDDLLDKIIRFQLERAYENDSRCYTIEDAMKL